MKKLLFIPLTALLLMACHHTQNQQAKPDSQQTASTYQQDTMKPATAPDAGELTTSPTSSDTTAQGFVRDTTAPLGSPQNPLKLEPGKPIDFSQLFKQNQETLTFGERSAKQIDTIRALAENGDKNAMFHYGTCYEQGWGVKRDFSKALEWYQKAADQDQKNAFGAIGGLYRLGKGVPVDPKKSAEWFTKGAEHEDENSMLCLGNCYYTGFGTKKDYKQAAHWK